MWVRLLDHRLRQMIVQGAMRLWYPDASYQDYGSGPPRYTVHMTDPSLPRRLVMNPELALGEAYTDGTLLIEGDDLYGFMDFIIRNLPATRAPTWDRPDLIIQHALRKVQQFNPMRRSRHNVAHHYDLSGKLYDLFLDADRQYSCAYFRHSSDTLEQAQQQKKAHIAAKLRLQRGMRVLDIGCGWGGLAISLARDHGVSVHGITLSQEQYAYATARAKREGFAGQVTFALADYRELGGTYDRIVSVGMFEHVGVPQYRTFFRRVRELLTEDGVALIHSIGRAAPPSSTGPWIRKYIFPGGYVPALSELMNGVEREDLWPTDIEVWRLHYAETLRHWLARFEANEGAARALYDERFCRMWRFYLVTSELTFRAGRQVVFQVQLARRQDAVPLTRDYLYSGDQADSERLAAE
ncbi:class I SAM-dependent methyltransferase [Phaeovulum sp.]|uniref:class I SAM-dependent methyltransferase n=1 Tax=Phaeovulum sp. TaxID=2934796 RepID=UPI0039E6C4C8